MPYLGNELATQFQAFVTQTITGDGSTGYTLDRAVANGKELLVYINNVKQEEGSGKSYTASGTTITFSEAVASTDSCYVVFLGSAVQTVVPPDASIVSGMIANANLVMPNTLDMNGNQLILDADADTSIEASSDDTIQVKVAGSEKLRIDSDGDIIIGKTAQNNTAAGTVIQNDGFASFVRDGNLSLIINRLTDDGTLIDFRKDGSSVGTIASSSGDFKIDAPADIILDADGSDIRLLDAGTEWGRIQNGTGSQLILQSKVSDEDMLFQGNDGGSNITALTLDMSAGGEATFGDNVIIGFQQGYKVEGGSGNATVSFTTTTGDGGANTVQVYWNATYGSGRAGGCLGAYDRSNTYHAPTASISSSNQFAIYGVIG